MDLVMPSASTVFLQARIHHLAPEPDAVTLPPSLLFSLNGGDRGREGGVYVKDRQTDTIDLHYTWKTSSFF